MLLRSFPHVSVFFFLLLFISQLPPYSGEIWALCQLRMVCSVLCVKNDHFPFLFCYSDRSITTDRSQPRCVCFVWLRVRLEDKKKVINFVCFHVSNRFLLEEARRTQGSTDALCLVRGINLCATIRRVHYALQSAQWRKVFCTGVVDILQTMLPAFVEP